jgi:hypothetical protein
MIQVIGQCVEAGNESGARQLFDVLETLLILVCAHGIYHLLLYLTLIVIRKFLCSANMSLSLQNFS